jgi:hypothetical protein
MRALTKRALVALTVSVWIAAVGSAAALTYDLNQPLQWRTAPSDASPPAGASPVLAAVAPAAPVAAREEAVLRIPTVTIVGRIAPRAVPAPAPTTRDISEMRCKEWRDLDMGSGHVQVCE